MKLPVAALMLHKGDENESGMNQNIPLTLFKETLTLRFQSKITLCFNSCNTLLILLTSKCYFSLIEASQHLICLTHQS